MFSNSETKIVCEQQSCLSESSEDDTSCSENDEIFEDNSLRSMCLFCDHIFDSPRSTFHHIQTSHNIDLLSMFITNKLDAFCYIKVINFIREMKCSVNDIENVLSNKIWSDDKYMKPFLEDDALLTFDIEEFTSDIAAPSSNCTRQQEVHDCSDNKVALYETQLREMKSLVNLLINEKEGTNQSPYYATNGEEYFSSYSHFSIHHEMLSDKVRTESYRNAILCNKDIFHNSEVLDVGCGTGILSLFAASSGAKSVVAVDNSEIIYKAIEIAHENALSNKIEFVKSKVEEKDWADRKFDFIVSEWMGYFLLFEGMLDTVLYARDNLLKRSGLLFPNRCILWMSAVSNMDAYAKNVTFWDDVYGFKMSVLKNDYFSEVSIEEVSPEQICTDSIIFKELNLMECTLEESRFIHSDFSLKCLKNCQITAITVWFDCLFDSDRLSTRVKLSTSPYSPVTHWKQSVLPLREPICVTQNILIEGKISVERSSVDSRSLFITLAINGYKVHRYTVQ